ncbi:hypothetical protein [Flavobacterium sp.]|uniref:hypothetical protein n=1 Tax=Flavobacterium sp. TaxID=239 RepID=UPI003D12CB81
MKKLFLSIVSFCAFLNTTAQAQTKNNTELIALATYIDSSVESQTSAATNALMNKLNQIVSASGLSSNYSRFILTANVTPRTKDVLGTAPTTIAYTMDVTFYIGDGIDGTKFGSITKTVKGVGSNESLAMSNAFKMINSADKDLQNFIVKGKEKIINFYNTRCDFIIKEAKMLEMQNQYDEALYRLTSVPDVCTSCYTKAMTAAESAYLKKINFDCKTQLQEAKLLWAANPTTEGANAVSEMLSGIDSRANCYAEVKTFVTTVAKRVKELDGREWKLKVDTELGLEQQRIKAMRDIGVAWGNGQPKSVTYNVGGWW